MGLVGVERYKSNINILLGFAVISVVISSLLTRDFQLVYCKPFLNISYELIPFLLGFMMCMMTLENFIILFIKYSLCYLIFSFIKVIILYGWGINLVDFLNLLIMQEVHGGQGDSEVLVLMFNCICLILLLPLCKLFEKFKRLWWVGLCISPVVVLVFYELPTYKVYTIPASLMYLGKSCFVVFSQYYWGYLLGSKKLFIMGWVKRFPEVLVNGIVCSICIQILEGYILMVLGVADFSSPYKLSCFITSVVLCACCYVFIIKNTIITRFIRFLGSKWFYFIMCFNLVMCIIEKWWGTVLKLYECVLYSFIITFISVIICMILYRLVVIIYYNSLSED